MNRGIIYVMSTVVSGLLKIGKTRTENYEQRMYALEHHGYANVTGLRREFAIEVEDYEKKERLLQDIFEKARIANTELFALKLETAVNLLSAFSGKQVYPPAQSIAEQKAETENIQETAAIPTSKSSNPYAIPDGLYYMRRHIRQEDRNIDAVVQVLGGKWIMQRESFLALQYSGGMGKRSGSQVDKTRSEMDISQEGVLMADYAFPGSPTPSFVANVVLLNTVNGWNAWKNSAGVPMAAFRDEKKQKAEER